MKVNSANEADLIHLAYAASILALADCAETPWDAPLGDVSPGEIENQCYRLATGLGLKPMVDIKNVEVLKSAWRRQLPNERQREIFDMANLLVRQHALVAYLQCHPNKPERLDLCFLLNQIREYLTGFFTRYGLKESLAKLPTLPLPGIPDEKWMDWSGDALRDCVIEELTGQTG